jgi:S-DNA-T family DNA segregation ATPase FtsK/SpoIIIE
MGLLDRPYEQRRDPLILDFSAAAGHGVIVGGPQSGKSATLRTVLTGLCLLNTPAELQIYCLDFGGGALSALSGLPHVGVVANRLQRDLVTRTVSQVARLLDRRESAFVEAGVDSVQEWRRRIRSGELAADGYGDVFLVIDGWGVLREKYEDLELLVTSIAARGLNFGVHVLIAAARWAEVRPALRDLLATRLELRLGDPTDSEINGKKAALVPSGQPGRGLTPVGLQFLSAVSRIDGRETAVDLAGGVADLVRRVAAGWTGEPAAPVRLLPPHLDYASVRESAGLVDPRTDGRGVLIGLDEDYEPLFWDPERDQHLIVIGADETGKSGLLSLLMRGVAASRTPEDTQFVLVDPRRGLLDVLEPQWLSGTAVVPDEAASMLAGAGAAVAKRVPGADITPTQLRERSWWHGPHMFVVIDDLELTQTASPLTPLLPLVPYANDIGLHLIIARSGSGANRAMYDSTLAGLRDGGAPFVIMDVATDEGPLVGTRKVANLPPGRGRWVSRRRGEFLLQVAEPS